MIDKTDKILGAVLSAWAKRATNTLGLLVFTTTQAMADFGPQRIISSNAIEVIDAFPADMDGDGDIDVLAAKPGSPFGGGSIVIYRNNGNGSFTELNNRFPGSSAALVSNVVGSDLDNDGDIDVVVGSSGFSSGGVRVYRNNGNLSFTRTFDNGNAPGLWDIHLADLNRDNRPEIIFSLGGSFDQIGIYINSGNLSSWGSLISAKTGTNTGDEPRSLHAADIDGDGDMDVISASDGDDKISWYENNGSQSFTARDLNTSSGMGVTGVFATDLDLDGDIDIFSASNDDDKVIFAMKKGIKLTVKGESSRGTKTADIYSLNGFTNAFNQLQNDC